MKPNGAIKIEKGIPMPPSKAGKEGKFAQALKALEAGDSFAFVDDPTARNAIYQLARRIKSKIAIRKVGKGQARAWRVS